MAGLVIIVISHTGCKEKQAPFADGNILLPTKDWMLTSFRLGVEYKVLLNTVTIELNALDSARDCELEDVVRFANDSTYRILDRGSICPETPDDLVRERGFWFLSPDQKLFTIDLLKNQGYLRDLEELNTDSTTFSVVRLDSEAIGLELRLQEKFEEAPVVLPDDYDIVIRLELTPGS